jgi:hypothetical protein
MSKSQDLIKLCAAATGLSPIFAESLVRRTIQGLSIPEEHFTPADIERLLPQLERSLALFLKPREASKGLERLRALAQEKAL